MWEFGRTLSNPNLEIAAFIKLTFLRGKLQVLRLFEIFTAKQSITPQKT